MLLRIAHRVRLVWWRKARPNLNGVCIVAMDREGRVLLVRHSYGSGKWSLPGGGLQRGEDPHECARREFREELLQEPDQLRLGGVIEHWMHGATSKVHVFGARLEDLPDVDGREVVEARFFAAEALPDDCRKMVLHRIAMLDVT